MQTRREMQLLCIAGSPLLHLTTENSVLTLAVSMYIFVLMVMTVQFNVDSLIYFPKHCNIH